MPPMKYMSRVWRAHGEAGALSAAAAASLGMGQSPCRAKARLPLLLMDLKSCGACQGCSDRAGERLVLRRRLGWVWSAVQYCKVWQAGLGWGSGMKEEDAGIMHSLLLALRSSRFHQPSLPEVSTISADRGEETNLLTPGFSCHESIWSVLIKHN